MSEPGIPTPEQLQQKLNEFMRSHFGDKVSVAAVPEVEAEKSEVEPPAHNRTSIFEFSHTPRDIKRQLDRYVIKQEEAKKVLGIAVCDHYNHAKFVERNRAHSAGPVEYAKQNVILIGPTGVGKTYLVKHIADLIGVPFVKADATKFSETGYMGGDVEDLVRELVQKANGDIALAEHGIIYIDEIDKIATSGNLIGRDVSGRGVQTTLLKLMEETEVPLRSQADLQSQLQAVMEFQRHGKNQRESINTRHILFIVSGAFDKLKDIIGRRVREGQIGFSAQPASAVEDASLFQQVTTRDLIDYGMEPEFIGRLPVRVICEPLIADDLFEIMKRSEGSILRQYERAFQAYGMEVTFEDSALRRIAEMASKENTGARALLTICERLFRTFKYELPGSGVTSLHVTERLFDEPKAVLEELLKTGHAERGKALAVSARQFAQRFSEKHGVAITFDDAAVEALVERALAEDTNIHELCQRLFKDYQFGLQLIQKNHGKDSFVIGADAVENPDGILSRWVVASYQEGNHSTPDTKV
ncbi:MAG: AAA family ATPase [Chthoniobacterales bacterium]